MTDDPTPCSNCGDPDGKRWSFDLDLPAIALCDPCSVTIAMQPDVFEAMGRRQRRRMRPAS